MSIAVAAAVVAASVGLTTDGVAAEPDTCQATRVNGLYVRAGQFKGGIAPAYDVLNGRFRLRVGGYRDLATGLSQKIPWSVSRGADVGTRLRIRGTRISPSPARTFTMNLRRTTASGDDRTWFFPSIVKPPAEGCWRLRFTSGRTTGSLVVLVRD